MKLNKLETIEMEKTREEMVRWVMDVAKAKEIKCELEHGNDNDNQDIIRLSLGLNNALSFVNVVILADEHRFCCYGFIDPKAGERKAEVAEFLMRACAGDSCGRFSLDYDDGEIYYIWCIPYVACVGENDIEALWTIPWFRFNDWGDGLLKVILGCATHKEAIDECVKKYEAEEAKEEKE